VDGLVRDAGVAEESGEATAGRAWDEQPEIVIKGACHFLQEDKGEEIAGHILGFMDRS
jgi:pimeloyl-ACP methyl ester carboxylesterase